MRRIAPEEGDTHIYSPRWIAEIWEITFPFSRRKSFGVRSVV
jgi:hypothetical protein